LKQALQEPGWLLGGESAGRHRRRANASVRDMCISMAASTWLNDDRFFDLLVILDATSEIYYAQLVRKSRRGRLRRACGR